MKGVNLIFPYWYLLVSVGGGLLYAALLYYKTKDFENKSKWLKPGLGFLRFFSVASIIFLLLDPIIRSHSKRIKKPIILIAQDNSESVRNAFNNKTDSLNYQKALKELEHKFAGKYEVHRYLFGEDIREGAFPDFTDKETDIASALGYLYDLYRTENIGAIILATDGNFNKGLHPLYVRPQLKAPIYSIALGDTTMRRDVVITAVYHNNIAYLGDLVKIHIDIKATLLKGNETRVSVLTKKNGKYQKISDRKLFIDKDDFFKSIEMTIPTERAGYTRFIVRLSPVEGEQNKKNNYRNFYIDILQARQKILLLANSPHPDIGTLKTALQANKNNEVSIQYADDIHYTPGMADIVILHQLPSYKHPISSLLSQLKKQRVPTLFIAGLQSNFLALNEAQDAVFVRPSGGVQLNEVTASINKNFNDFHLSDQLVNELEQFPALYTAFGTFSPKPNAKTLLYQKILKLKTNHSLLSFSNKNGRKTGVFCATGIYKWRLFDYLKHRSFDVMEELLQNAVRYLSVKDDKSRFRVRPVKPFFKESEPVHFIAERYNAVYEPDNSGEIDMRITDSLGNNYDFAFTRTDNAYELNTSKMPAGEYKYIATTKLDGKVLKKRGSFTVSTLDIEQAKDHSNRSLLLALSGKTGGKMIYPSMMERLYEMVPAEHQIKPIAYQSIRTRPLIHLKWPLFLLILTLSFEWFLRRYYGKY